MGSEWQKEQTDATILEAYNLAKNDLFYEALSLLDGAYQKAIEENYLEGQVRALRVYSYAYGLLGLLDDCLKASASGLELLKQEETSSLMEGRTPIAFIFLNNIATIYSFLNRNEEALDYYTKALEHVNQDDGSAYVLIRTNLGETYLLMGELDRALECVTDALQFVEEHHLGTVEYQLCHYEFGLIYKKIGKPELAMEHLLLSLEYAEQDTTKFSKVNTLVEIGRLSMEQNNLEAALTYLETAIDEGTAISANEIMRDAHRLIADCYEQHQDFEKAIYHLKVFLEVNKQVVSVELEKQMNAFTTEFRIEQAKKDAEIYKLRNVELKQKNEEIELKAKEIEASYKNLAILSQIGHEITASLDVEKVLTTIYDRVKTLMKVNCFGIALYEEATNMLDYKMFIEESVRLPSFKHSIDDNNSFASACIRNRQEVLINNTTLHQYTVAPKIQASYNPRRPQSLIYYPLLLGEQIIGVISVQSYEVDAYSLRDLEAIKILASYIAIAVNNSQKSEALTAAIADLEISSTTDPLTELNNRRYMINKITDEYNRFQRSQHPFVIIVTDIDYFKDINDTYGHDCGDFVLKELANLFKSTLRKQDYIARWGGEEFLILLTDTDVASSLIMAERLRQTIMDHVFHYQEEKVQVTLTFGISEYCDNLSMEDIIKRADRALYQGKSSGRNKCVVYDQLSDMGLHHNETQQNVEDFKKTNLTKL